MTEQSTTIEDQFGRRFTSLRLAVNERCNLRCLYCMNEDKVFPPDETLLSLEAQLRLISIVSQLGVHKIRLTGGEPLLHPDILSLVKGAAETANVQSVHLTTNGVLLSKMASDLKTAGLSGVNISLDSLQAPRFKVITRTGDLNRVLEGIDAAIAQGIDRIRLNVVVLDGLNRDEVLPLTQFALAKNIHISFIEEMPLGQVNVGGKPLAYVSSDALLAELNEHFCLEPISAEETAGPSRDYLISGSTTRVGFISPHSNNFCAQCNRLRISAEGRLLMCLGNEESIDLRGLLRSNCSDDEIKTAIIGSLSIKPERHVFDRPDEPQIVRFMNATGG